MVPQFYLITPPIDDPLAIQPKLDALVSTGVFGVVLLRIAATSEVEIKRIVAGLREPLVGAGIAVLVDLPEDARLVVRLQIDGAHAAEPSRLAGAIESLKPQRILGVGGLRSRHDAMEAGEKDIDYIMFGEPRPDGFVPPLAQTVDRASWWAEIFNIPCVAYASAIDDIAGLASTGAEFIALGPWLFAAVDPAKIAAEARRIAKANARLAVPAG